MTRPVPAGFAPAGAEGTSRPVAASARTATGTRRLLGARMAGGTPRGWREQARATTAPNRTRRQSLRPDPRTRGSVPRPGPREGKPSGWDEVNPNLTPKMPPEARVAMNNVRPTGSDHPDG